MNLGALLKYNQLLHKAITFYVRDYIPTKTSLCTRREKAEVTFQYITKALHSHLSRGRSAYFFRQTVASDTMYWYFRWCSRMRSGTCCSPIFAKPRSLMSF